MKTSELRPPRWARDADEAFAVPHREKLTNIPPYDGTVPEILRLFESVPVSFPRAPVSHIVTANLPVVVEDIVAKSVFALRCVAGGGNALRSILAEFTFAAPSDPEAEALLPMYQRVSRRQKASFFQGYVSWNLRPALEADDSLESATTAAVPLSLSEDGNVTLFTCNELSAKLVVVAADGTNTVKTFLGVSALLRDPFRYAVMNDEVIVCPTVQRGILCCYHQLGDAAPYHHLKLPMGMGCDNATFTSAPCVFTLSGVVHICIGLSDGRCAAFDVKETGLQSFRLALASEEAQRSVAITAVTLSPDVTLLAVGYEDGHIAMEDFSQGGGFLWSASHCAPGAPSSLDNAVTHLAFNPMRYWLSSCSRRGVMIYDLEHHASIWSYAAPDDVCFPTAFCWSPDGNRAHIGCSNGMLQVWSTQTALFEPEPKTDAE